MAHLAWAWATLAVLVPLCPVLWMGAVREGKRECVRQAAERGAGR